MQTAPPEPGTGLRGVGGMLDRAKVSTVSLTTTSAIDLDKFNMWMGQLLQEKGNDLYRFKGILNMHGYNEKFVVQGEVHFCRLLHCCVDVGYLMML